MSEDGSAGEGRAGADEQSAAERERPGRPGEGPEGDGLPDPLVDVVADPADGRHRLPYLLGLLDSDDPRERLAAATAVALVVETDPDMLAYAVGRLVDRLDDDAPVEVAHALDYLAARRPREVDAAVADLTDDAERRARERMYRTGAGFARNEYLAPTGGDRPVGRTRVAGGDADAGPQRVYTSDADEERDDESQSGSEDEAADDGADDAGDDGGVEPGVAGDEDTGRGVTSATLSLVSKRLSAVIGASRFDDIDVLTERRRGRHGDVYRAAGTLDGEDYAVGLTVYRAPDDHAGFASGFRAAMGDWTDVDDHESVLPVYDWGVRPRPWAAVDHVEGTLATLDGDPPGPLWVATECVGAVAYAHQHGVVHGAIDPGNVGFRDNALTEGERRRPLLTNVALAAGTGTARPGTGVDPRYAAPEHYDDRFGRVDNATDVYGLGALVYRLATGHHPYEGDAETVRERVLAEGSPAPTAVDPDLPAALDQVVRKATATRKLKRYETVNHLGRELRTIRETDGT